MLLVEIHWQSSNDSGFRTILPDIPSLEIYRIKQKITCFVFCTILPVFSPSLLHCIFLFSTNFNDFPLFDCWPRFEVREKRNVRYAIIDIRLQFSDVLFKYWENRPLEIMILRIYVLRILFLWKIEVGFNVECYLIVIIS